MAETLIMLSDILTKSLSEIQIMVDYIIQPEHVFLAASGNMIML